MPALLNGYASLHRILTLVWARQIKPELRAASCCIVSTHLLAVDMVLPQLPPSSPPYFPGIPGQTLIRLDLHNLPELSYTSTAV